MLVNTEVSPPNRTRTLTITLDDEGVEALIHIFARHATNGKGEAGNRDIADKLYRIVKTIK